jgi:hypothetical protein
MMNFVIGSGPSRRGPDSGHIDTSREVELSACVSEL